jgi:phage-related protein
MIITIVEALIDNVDQLIDAALKIIIALAEGLINSLPKLIEKAPVIISKLVNAIISEVPQLVRAGAQLITEMAGGLISALPSVLTAAAEIAVAIPRTISNGVSSMVDAGFQLVSGLWQGISNSWSSLVSNVQSLAGNLVSGVKSVLGIHSPSKVFAEIGDYCVQGMEEGLEPLANGSIMEDSLDAIRSFDGVSISASTSSQNSKVEALLAQIQDLLENQSIVLDTGALVGNTVRQYDKALGKRVALAGRGI